jgi:hypothetical protein
MVENRPTVGRNPTIVRLAEGRDHERGVADRRLNAILEIPGDPHVARIAQEIKLDRRVGRVLLQGLSWGKANPGIRNDHAAPETLVERDDIAGAVPWLV